MIKALVSILKGRCFMLAPRVPRCTGLKLMPSFIGIRGVCVRGLLECVCVGGG